MRRLCRIAAATTASALLLALTVNASSAETLDVSEDQVIQTWPALTFTSSIARVSCPVTLTSTFSSSTFATTAGTRIGTVTRLSVGTCTGGTVTVLSETLPWAINYHSLTGTPPNIGTLTFDLVGLRVRAQSAGVTCLLQTTTSEPLRVVATRDPDNVITGLRADETAPIDLSESFLCDAAGDATASGTATVAGAVEEGARVANEIAIFLDGAANMLREEGGNLPLKLQNMAVGGEATLSLTKADPNVRVKITNIAAISGRPERFSINFGAANSCVVNAAMPAGGCNVNIRNNPAGAAESRVRITYKVQKDIQNPPLQIQEFAVRAQ